MLWKFKLLKIILLFLSALMISNCNKNFYDEFANKQTDRAHFNEALKKLNAQDFSGAILECQKMSAGFSQKRESRFICASAYAGRCGYKALDLVQDVLDWDAVADLLFQHLLNLNVAATTEQSDDCQVAENILRENGPAASRTSDENLFLILMGLKQIGVISNIVADTNDDGAVDGGFNACDNIEFPELNVRRVGSAFWEINQSAASSDLGVLDPVALATGQVCAALEALNPAINFCEADDPADFTADHLRGIRTLVNENNAIGLGECVGGQPGCECT